MDNVRRFKCWNENASDVEKDPTAWLRSNIKMFTLGTAWLVQVVHQVKQMVGHHQPR